MANKADKIWTDAVRRALHRESEGKGSPKWLDVLANRLVEAAADGDVSALREVGDRIEGKPTQRMEHGGPDGGAIPTELNITITGVPSDKSE